MDCLEKLVDCIGRFNKGEIDADTSCQIEKQILTDEIDDPEFLNFAVENISELFGYLATGRVNIRICRDIEGPPPMLPCTVAAKVAAPPQGGAYLAAARCRK